VILPTITLHDYQDSDKIVKNYKFNFGDQYALPCQTTDVDEQKSNIFVLTSFESNTTLFKNTLKLHPAQSLTV